jgi:hypothetical protein
MFADGFMWDNTNSDGSDIYSVIGNVPDMFSCQYMCYTDPNCLYFSHNKLDQFCFLKNGTRSLIDDPVSISGPKNCSGGVMAGQNLAKTRFTFILDPFFRNLAKTLQKPCKNLQKHVSRSSKILFFETLQKPCKNLQNLAKTRFTFIQDPLFKTG